MTAYLPKILITGSDGQVGTAICTHANNKDFQLIACNKNVMDITQPASIEQAIKQFSPDIIINTAAYTAVDKAEKDSESALLVNHLGAKYLAIACNKNKIPLLHFSTDYIFDGTKTLPYHEIDAANPLNVYGNSKWLGEEMVREHCEQHIILRVSGVFSEYKNNFVKTILRLAQEKKELNIVSDQITNPTYAGHIASVTYSLIKNLHTFGTYHYCDQPSVSWYEFATNIIENARLHQPLSIEKIHPILAAEYKTEAKRPAYSVLACNKIRQDYGILQTSWETAISHLTRK